MNSLVIGWNVIKRLLQQKISLGFLVIFPILAGLFIVLMMGKTTGTEQIIGMVNKDTGNMGQEMVRYLDGLDNYEIIEIEEEEIEKKIIDEDFSVVVIIPDNYSNNIINKQNQTVKITTFRPSSSYLKLKEIINGYLREIYSGQSSINSNDNLTGAKGLNISPITDQTRTYLGFLLIMVMLFMGTGIGMILEDKKEKTFMRTFAAPVRKYEMALGNVLASFAIGLVQIIIYLTFTTYLFKVDWGTSMINIFIISLVYLIAAVGITIGISGFIKDNQRYGAVNTFTVIPVSLLGGCFFPVTMLPDSVQRIANFIPQKWAMEALEKLAAGKEFASININLLILLLFGIVFFTFGIRTLRVTNEDL